MDIELPTLNNTWIFGNVFLQVYYSVFDLKARRVGLAPAAV